MKREFKILFFVIRDLKVLRELLTDIRDFTTLLVILRRRSSEWLESSIGRTQK